jgi:hypothetical protein
MNPLCVCLSQCTDSDSEGVVNIVMGAAGNTYVWQGRTCDVECGTVEAVEPPVVVVAVRRARWFVMRD